MLGVIFASISLWIVYIAGYVLWDHERLRGGGPRRRPWRRFQILAIFSALQVAILAFSSQLTLRGGSANGTQKPLQSGTHILSLQWAASYCYNGVDFRGRACHPSCYRPYWTIHGLWGPLSFCGAYEQFSVDALNFPDMEDMWPTCLRSRANSDFWSYEWDKHGTCYRYHPRLGSVRLYFGTTVQTTRNANVQGMLAAVKIFPSHDKQWSLYEITNALRKGHGADVNINCENRGKSLLSEVHLCYDDDLKPVNCDYRRSRCRDAVYYPPTPGAPGA